MEESKNKSKNINENKNILKVRDDRDYIVLIRKEDEKEFSINPIQNPDWCSNSLCTKSELRSRIEPWLTSLFQSEHLSLLVGSGLSTAIQHEVCDSPDNGMNSNLKFTNYSTEIENAAKDSAKKIGRNEPNNEDRIRVANELIKGLTILSGSADIPDITTKLAQLCSDFETVIEEFTNGIFQIEANIAGAKPEERESAFNKLVLFLMSFASRTGTRDRLNIFTTNYDRLIEAGADVAGLRLIDRFVGALSPVFRSSRMDIDMHYNPPGIRGEPRYLEGVARFTKLHGSLDWVDVGGNIRKIGLPFGAKSIKPFLETAGLNASYSSLMIYPNSAKDRETTEYPYVELFRDFAAALCRPNSTLVTYGYSFGDDHINRVIRDMLTIPSTHLVIIDYGDSSGRIMDKYKSWGHQSQMSLLIGKDLANIDDLVNYYLPKPSIDRATIRMADILNQRFNQSLNKDSEGKTEEKAEGELLKKEAKEELGGCEIGGETGK